MSLPGVLLPGAAPLASEGVGDFSQYGALRAAARQQDPAALREAAQQVETLFAQMLIQSMRATSFGDDGLGAHGDVYRDLYDQQVAKALAKGKGLGIADLLVQQLQQTAQSMRAPDAAAAGLPLGPAVTSQGMPLGPGAGGALPGIPAVGAQLPLAPLSRKGPGVAVDAVATPPAGGLPLPARKPSAQPAVQAALQAAIPSAQPAPANPAAALRAYGVESQFGGAVLPPQALPKVPPAAADSNVVNTQSSPAVSARWWSPDAVAGVTGVRAAARPRDAGVPAMNAAAAAGAAAPAAPRPRALPVDARAWVTELLPHAQRAGAQLGVPPEFLIAQAALETGWGRHLPRHADGTSSNNLFGIKAHRWTGATVQTGTLEFVDGAMRPEQASFRAYGSVGDCFDDYVAFLRSNPRYRTALAHGGDPVAYIQGLQKAGYATDPQYAAKIQQIAADGRVVAAALAARGAQPPSDRPLLSADAQPAAQPHNLTA